MKFLTVFTVTVTGAVTVALAACGSPVPSAPDAPASFREAVRLPVGSLDVADETFRWKMTVARLDVATFELHARGVGDVVRVVSAGKASGVARFFRTLEIQAVSVIERQSGRTRSSLSELRGQGRFHRVSRHFSSDGLVSIAGSPGEMQATKRHAIAGLAPLSSETFLLGLRSWSPQRGDRAIAVVAGDETLWLVELQAETPQMIEVPIGRRRARELVGTARRISAAGVLEEGRPRPLSIFVSDDAARLPLRVQSHISGSKVVVELTSHEMR